MAESMTRRVGAPTTPPSPSMAPDAFGFAATSASSYSDAPRRGSGWEEKTNVETRADVSPLAAAPGLRCADRWHWIRHRHPEKLHRRRQRADDRLRDFDCGRLLDLSCRHPACLEGTPR